MGTIIGDIARLVFIGKKSFFQKLGTIELSLVTNRLIQESSTVTTNPIEDGSYVNDHVIKNPTNLSITGLVTEATLKNSILSRGLSLENPLLYENNLQDVHDEIYRLYNAREPISIVTPFKTYDNMVMTDLSIPSDIRTSTVFTFTASFVEIVIVSSKIVAVNNQLIKSDNAKQKENKGKQTAEKATDEQAENVKKIEEITLFEGVKLIFGFGI